MTNPMYLTLNPVAEAMETILRTMHEAEEGGQHTPGSWRKEGAEHHVGHAFIHINSAVLTDVSATEYWEHIRHALTRLSMAVENHKRGLDADYGTEGAGATR